jgi:hypothetical protein
MFDRLNKKFLILLEPSNILWSQYKKEKYARNQNYHFSLPAAVEEVFNEGSFKNFQNWAKEQRDPTAILNIYSGKIKEKLGLNISGNMFSNEVSSKKFGAYLGLNAFSCNYIFDRSHTEYRNQFESIAFDRVTAEDLARRFCGLYVLYILDDAHGEVAICSFDVRYFIANTRRRGKKLDYRVRCKLNMPNDTKLPVHPEKAYFEYDGFLAYRPNCLTFLFESRRYSTERANIQICLAEHVQTVANREFRTGQLMTTGGNGLYEMGAYRVALEKRLSRSLFLKPETGLTSLDGEEDVNREFLNSTPRRVERDKFPIECALLS